VIKEIPGMTAVPAETASRPAARVLALALVQVLALGLPDPDYITISPQAAGTPSVSSIDLLFSEGDPLSAVQDWADRFGVTVTRQPDRKDPARCWVSAEFTYLGMVFEVFAHVAADGS
jgi:hypothetical protein